MKLARARALAARLPPLLIQAERAAAALQAGAHGRRRTGPGESFWQYRRHQPGDAAAAVDWRKSARGHTLYVRETEWAAARTAYFWCDGSGSMAWRSRDDLPEKGERAELITLALAAALLRGGERVAPLGGPPVAGLETLAGTLPAGGLAGGLPLPRHGEAVLVSDFLMPPEDLHTHLRRLASAGGGGHLLQVLDPAEETLPFTGRIRFAGLEDDGEMLVRRAEDLRPAYRDRLAAHRDAVAACARACGWTFAVHHTDQPPQAALLALFTRLGGA